jgi:cytoskeletal protein RodZ
MTFENMDTEFEPGSEEAGPPPEESSNRPFLMVAGILGGIMLLSLIAIVAFALARPLLSGGSNRQTQAAEINLQNTEVARAVSLTEVAVAALATPSPTQPPPTATLAPTNTLVVAQQVTNTPLPTTDPRTATVAALLTQAADAQKTEPAATPTQLPTTGFADDVGAPGLLALAALLVVVIFLSRRLRTAS